MDDHVAEVRYGVKELLAMLERTLTDQITGIANRLEKIDSKLDEKASNLRADAMELRIGVNEDRITKLELLAAGTQAISTFQRWMVGLAVALLGGGIGTLIYLATGSGGHP